MLEAGVNAHMNILNIVGKKNNNAPELRKIEMATDYIDDAEVPPIE